MDHEILIPIESDLHSARELAQFFEASGAPPAGASFELRESSSPLRMDPTVLVALISGGFSVVAALVTGLLPLLQEARRPSVIRIEDRDGNAVEVPADTPPDRLPEIVAAARGRHIVRLRIVEVER